MKSVLLIGLGRYGRHVARKLCEQGNEVLAVDKNEELVNQVLSFVTNALIADSTDQNFLASLGVRNFDVAIVAIGDDFQSSLETTLQLKELGARQIVARAASSIHEKILFKSGADEVVYPEKQLALWTAMRYGSDHLLDYFALSSRYGVYEVTMPIDWAGHTVGELDIRRNYHVNVLGVRLGGHLTVDITPKTKLQEGDTVLILGKHDNIEAIIGKF
ncbi:TrkA family potassium uptake protein [uncultured Mitsuokella sp.]|uniref:potassium channel family protein n=1 Tax=uncultured Mitsuokella sp. TaxID=453120 RepID=UPI0026354BC8|nr:TrkA family potassium uptake protein [uncultured Mitsuokella sp.]